MPNVFPDDILARVRALQAQFDALSTASYVDISEGPVPGSPAPNTMRLYVTDNAGTTELHALDASGNDYTLAP